MYEWIKSGFMTRVAAQTFFDYFSRILKINHLNGMIQANVVTACGKGKAGRPLRGPVCFGHVTIFHGKSLL